MGDVVIGVFVEWVFGLIGGFECGGLDVGGVLGFWVRFRSRR